MCKHGLPPVMCALCNDVSFEKPGFHGRTKKDPPKVELGMHASERVKIAHASGSKRGTFHAHTEFGRKQLLQDIAQLVNSMPDLSGIDFTVFTPVKRIVDPPTTRLARKPYKETPKYASEVMRPARGVREYKPHRLLREG